MELFRNAIYLMALFCSRIAQLVAYLFPHISISPTAEPVRVSLLRLAGNLNTANSYRVQMSPSTVNRHFNALKHKSCYLLSRMLSSAPFIHLNCDITVVAARPPFCLFALFKQFISALTVANGLLRSDQAMAVQIFRFKFTFYEWERSALPMKIHVLREHD